MWALPPATLTHATYLPVGTAGAFTQGATANVAIPGSALALPLGITNEGTEFEFSFDTEEDSAAEYYYPLRTVVTGQTAKLSTSLKTVNLTNLRYAFNAATTAWSATPSATTPAYFTPPAPGEEVRIQILWESLANDLFILGYSAFQTNAVTLAAVKGSAGLNLELAWNLEQPDAAIAPVPFKMGVLGASWVETIAAE